MKHPPWRTAVAYLTVPWAAFALVFWAIDVLEDRSKRLVVLDVTELHASWELESTNRTNPVVQTLSPGSSLPVKRIRYGKDYMAVRVCAEPATSCGWVFYDERIEIR